MKSSKKTVIPAIVAVIIVILIVVLLLPGKKSGETAVVASNSCVAKQFGLNATGNCVSDIQTMVNFMETDNLTQCPFVGGSRLSTDGNYNSATLDQVKVVQTWLNCYSQQEGQPTRVDADGTVTNSTWSGLCTYAYQYPSQTQQSPSTYRSASLAAGKNAGC